MSPRPVFLRRLALVAALLALAATARAGAVAGVPMGNGDQITAEIDSPGDEDTFVASLGAGSALALEIRLPKGSTFLPRVRAFRPDGFELALDGVLVGEGTSKVVLALPVLNQTGTWKFAVGSKLSTTGAYTIALKEKRSTKGGGKGILVAGGTYLERTIAATDGELLTFAARVKSGPAAGTVEVLDPSGEPLPGVDGALVRKGTAVAGKKIALAGGHGDYTLRILNPGPDDAVVDLKTALKVVKVKKRKETLGAEPRPSSMTPGTGRDGITVTITGKDFVEGARVYFGAEAATDVVVGGATQLVCKAPPGAESSAGEAVTVCVVNPDDQLGLVTAKFAYHGLAAPSGLSPPLSPLAGGQTITLTGKNFRAGATVTVDGVPATGVVVGSGISLTFVSPPHAAGPVEVVVTDEYERDGAGVPGLRYSDPPAATSATPDTVPSFGLRTVTLTGQNFHAGTEVLVDAVPASGVTILSETSLRFVPPGGVAGTTVVTLRDVLGRSTSSGSLLARARSLVNVTASSAPPAPTGTEFFASTIGVGDIDGDGRPDLLLASPTLRAGGPLGTLPGSRLLRNGGTGVFTDVTSTNMGAFTGSNGDFGQASAAVLTDFTKDGRAEAMLTMREVASAGSATFSYAGGFVGRYVGDVPTLGSSRLLLNNGVGVLSNASSTRLPSPLSTPDHGIGNRFQGSTLLVGDVDNDSDIDMVLVHSSAVTRGVVSQVKKTYTKVKYYYYYYNYYPENAYIYQSATLASATRVLRNNGSGTFTFVWTSLPAPTYSSGGNLVDDFRADGAALGDVDGDGTRDLVLVSATPRVVPDANNAYVAPALRILKGGASGTFTRQPAAIPATYESAHAGSGDSWQGSAVALIDLTADGRPELVLGRSTFSYWLEGSEDRLLPAIRIFRNNGNGTFAEDTASFIDETLFRTGSTSTILGVTDFQVGDVDGDGKQDLVLTGKVHEVAPSGNTGLGAKKILPAGTRPATRLLRQVGGKLVDVTADWIPAGSNGDWLQSDVVRLLDLNGDGRLDAVLGAEKNPVTPGQTTLTNRPLRILKNQ